MKRTIPLLITAISGFILAVAPFIPAWQNAREEVAIWFDILASIAFVLGGGNLLRLHLQQISDQKPGWAYSGITLVSFTMMLVFGILKFGSPPEVATESYGESAVPFVLTDLPEFRIPGVIPHRADGVELPKSVRAQTREAEGEILFRGWMTRSQKEDLAGYVDVQAWRCDAEKLFKLAQPPAELAGRIRYSADQQRLFFSGVMSPANRQQLSGLFRSSPDVEERLNELEALATKKTSLAIRSIPATLSIPATGSIPVTVSGSELEVTGPMSPEDRETLVRVLSNPTMARPLNQEARQALLQELLDRGTVTGKQQTVFEQFYDADWKPEQLIAVINSAGIVSPQPKSPCDLLNELSAGVVDPTLTTPPPAPQLLNGAQEQAVRDYVNSPSMLPAELITQLQSAGTLTAAQAAASHRFFVQQPTQAEQWRSLCFRLLETGPLNSAQREFLLTPIRRQFEWQQDVGVLFMASQQVKYPWSGNYSAQGTPFWWLYEYVLQPLLTTTFALLAFYVASAAFRAFRAKNLEAILLLGTAFLILLGRTSAGAMLTNGLPEALAFLKMDNLMVYIMSIFNTAGNRAIMIGIALGTISTSLRVLLGVDRSYLGSSDK